MCAYCAIIVLHFLHYVSNFESKQCQMGLKKGVLDASSIAKTPAGALHSFMHRASFDISKYPDSFQEWLDDNPGLFHK